MQCVSFYSVSLYVVKLYYMINQETLKNLEACVEGTVCKHNRCSSDASEDDYGTFCKSHKDCKEGKCRISLWLH